MIEEKEGFVLIVTVLSIIDRLSLVSPDFSGPKTKPTLLLALTFLLWLRYEFAKVSTSDAVIKSLFDVLFAVLVLSPGGRDQSDGPLLSDVGIDVVGTQDLISSSVNQVGLGSGVSVDDDLSAHGGAFWPGGVASSGWGVVEAGVRVALLSRSGGGRCFRTRPCRADLHGHAAGHRMTRFAGEALLREPNHAVPTCMVMPPGTA